MNNQSKPPRTVILTDLSVEYQGISKQLAYFQEEIHSQGAVYERGTLSSLFLCGGSEPFFFEEDMQLNQGRHIVEGLPEQAAIPESNLQLGSVQALCKQTVVLGDLSPVPHDLLDFFISYTKADRMRALWIANHLAQAGYSVFLPPVDFRAGAILRNELLKAFSKARRLLVVLSPSYFDALLSRMDGWGEFKQAVKQSAKILTVLVNIREDLHKELEKANLGYLDIIGEKDLTARSLLWSHVSDIGVAISSPPPFMLEDSHVPLSDMTTFTTTMAVSLLMQEIEESFARKDWSEIGRKVQYLIKQRPEIMYLVSILMRKQHPLAYDAFYKLLTLVSDEKRRPLTEEYVKTLIDLDRWSETLELAPDSEFWLRLQQKVNCNSEQVVHRKRPTKARGIRVFFSYSHADEKMREELEKHLSSLKRQHGITAWHNGKIMPGVDWEEEINFQLSQAHIVLLLISSDFIYSNHCYEKEMQKAMERHKRGEAWVVPIILRPADWESSAFGKLQPLPLGGRPITLWKDKDEAYVNIAKGLQKIVADLQGSI